jgi:hypothetical protein
VVDEAALAGRIVPNDSNPQRAFVIQHVSDPRRQGSRIASHGKQFCIKRNGPITGVRFDCAGHLRVQFFFTKQVSLDLDQRKGIQKIGHACVAISSTIRKSFLT